MTEKRIRNVPLTGTRIHEVVLQAFKGSGLVCGPTKHKDGEASSVGAMILPSGKVGVGTARTSIERVSWNPFLVRQDVNACWVARIAVKELSRSLEQREGRSVECVDVAIETEPYVTREWCVAAFLASLLPFFALAMFFPVNLIPTLIVYYVVKGWRNRKALADVARKQALEERVSGILEAVEKDLRADSAA